MLIIFLTFYLHRILYKHAVQNNQSNRCIF